jgi:hypothetical protein
MALVMSSSRNVGTISKMIFMNYVGLFRGTMSAYKVSITISSLG